MNFEAWFEMLHPDDRRRATEANIRSFKTGKFDETFRVCHPRKGEIRWLRAVSTFVDEQNDQPMQLIGLIVDVTDEKRIAEAAREEIAKQEKWRRRMQKLEAIGTLSAGIAHDFNNLIAVILGNVQLAMDDVKKGSRTRKNMDEIYDSCLRARDIVKQILTFFAGRGSNAQISPPGSGNKRIHQVSAIHDSFHH